MIDIVDLKKADYLTFYVSKSLSGKYLIYCENIKTNEIVALSNDITPYLLQENLIVEEDNEK